MLFNVDKALSLPDIRHIVAKRDEVLDRFGPIFRDPQSLTKQDYLDFLSFKHNHHWTGLERLGRRATDDMESLRGAITVLVSLARRKIPCRGGTCLYRGMRRDDICLYLSPADRARLETLVSDRNTPRKLVWRAEIVLATADGHGTAEVMRRARTSKPTVWRWQQRYLDAGVAGLMRDKTRPARVPPLPRETRLKVIAKTVRETPANATHWSRSLMAEAVGISPSSVGRIWAEAGLKPHLTRSFKVSNDPMFEEKVTDIVGLYLDPPERAVVLCVDEKSQIEALDRTQPGLPLKEGHAATTTHDYRRHGTTTLFAALDVKSGRVIGECRPRHRAKEFLKFLRRIDQDVPRSRAVHLVLDNYATHKTPEVRAWLETHPRFRLHFTPTRASWLNLVERFFAEITARRIRRGSYTSVDELEAAIYDYLLRHNASPKPFVWTKSANDILVRERRALDALDEIRGNR